MGLVLDDLLTEFVYTVVNPFEKLIPRFLCHQTQRRAFGNHVVEPMLCDFVEVSVVGANKIERIMSDITRLMRIGCEENGVVADHQIGAIQAVFSVVALIFERIVFFACFGLFGCHGEDAV